MNNIVSKIREIYKVDGENEAYIELYNSKQEVLSAYDEDAFEDKFGGNIHQESDLDKVAYPIITFERTSDADGHMFDANENEEDIFSEADEYFEKK